MKNEGHTPSYGWITDTNITQALSLLKLILTFQVKVLSWFTFPNPVCVIQRILPSD